MTHLSTTSAVSFVSAIAFLAIAAQLVAGTATCPSFEAKNDVYNMDSLPYSCSADLSVCAEGLCYCLGGSLSKGDHACVDLSADATCDDYNFCTRIYAFCVATAANGTNATCAGDWYTFIDDQVREQILAPESANSSQLYDSCSGFACEFVNASLPDCVVDYGYVCQAPFAPTNNSNAPTLSPLPAGANVPIPTTINGAPAIPVTRISALIIFTGDFKALFAQGKAAVKRLMDAIASSFTTKFNRPFMCLNATEGSLQATVATDVPQGQTGTVDAIKNNIKSLNSDASSNWYAAILNTCQSSGACSTGIGAPTVKSIFVTDISAASNPPVQQKCGTGCVAGIIIACVAVALIITVVTVVIVKRSSRAGTGSANEPTEEMKPTTGDNSNAV